MIVLPSLLVKYTFARQHSTVGSPSDSRDIVPRFNTWFSHILPFLLLLIQEGQLSVTGESMHIVHKVMVSRLGGLSLPRKV